MLRCSILSWWICNSDSQAAKVKKTTQLRAARNLLGGTFVHLFERHASCALQQCMFVTSQLHFGFWLLSFIRLKRTSCVESHSPRVQTHVFLLMCNEPMSCL